MAAQLRISAKTLGGMAMPDFCPRCFWLKLHAGSLPFQVFPGIFSSIDSYTKKIIQCYFDGHDCFPSWLNELGELTGYMEPPHYSRFKVVDPGSGATLWGTPDGIFIRKDGTHVIIDYKTARYTENQDKLMPMYEVQLNAYADIGEKSGIVKPVSGLALVYMEPVTHEVAATDGANHRHDGFAMGFSARVHRIELKPNVIPELMHRANEIYQLVRPPDGVPGCKDCESLDNLVGLIVTKH